MISKTCKWCKEEKLLEEFHKQPRMKNGRSNKCKSCQQEYNKIYKRSEKYKIQRNKRRRERYVKDSEYKIYCIVRSRLISALAGAVKDSNTVDYLGCTILQLKQYIESKFQPGMTWQNHGEWHIDHIRPLASFDLSNERQIEEACNYKNLQPLWAIDNLRKSSKWD